MDEVNMPILYTIMNLLGNGVRDQQFVCCILSGYKPKNKKTERLNDKKLKNKKTKRQKNKNLKHGWVGIRVLQL